MHVLTIYDFTQTMNLLANTLIYVKLAYTNKNKVNKFSKMYYHAANISKPTRAVVIITGASKRIFPTTVSD